MANTIKNIAKGESYKISFERIKLSLAKGFPLEAVCLIESIISDRLLSNAVGAGQLPEQPENAVKSGFQRLITLFKNYAKENNDQEAAELAGVLDDWRDRRNKVVHSAVKSYPKTSPKMLPSEFWNEAALLAQEGVSHARRLLRWHRGILRTIKAPARNEPIRKLQAPRG